jgi:hypothetical protein
MAMLWLPLDDAVIDTMCVLADGSWEAEELDATWRRSGRAMPSGSVAHYVFESLLNARSGMPGHSPPTTPMA